MTSVLVDSNVILDILTEDPQWFDWSSHQLTIWSEQATLVINPLIYAEIAVGFTDENQLETVLSPALFQREPLPYAAAFIASQAFFALSSEWRA